MYSSTLVLSSFLALWLGLASAATLTYDFNITWVYANPDGLYRRPVQGINNQWPIPSIEAVLGDQIVINLHNQLGNASTTLHFHGLFQNGTAAMDGPAGSVQCSIPPGVSLTYNFTVRLYVRCQTVNKVDFVTGSTNWIILVPLSYWRLSRWPSRAHDLQKPRGSLCWQI